MKETVSDFKVFVDLQGVIFVERQRSVCYWKMPNLYIIEKLM